MCVLGLVHCSDNPASSSDGGADLSTAADLSVADLSLGDLASADLTPAASCGGDGGASNELRCTGLYSNWATRTIDPANREFEPTYRLWSDGASKRRWMYLPPGTQIDVTNMNAWSFPVGTKFWKEFQLNIGGVDKRVETRLLWKTDPFTWTMTTYAWSSDEMTATELPGGMLVVPGTTNYEIPSTNNGGCTVCHDGRADRVLGFEAVSLAEATPFGWNELKTLSLVTSTNGNHTLAASALHVPGNATEKAAIGYLHANCGNACHHPGGSGPFSMRVDIASGTTPVNVQSTTAFGAINTASGFIPTGGTGNYYRIRPTDTSRSTIHLRMNVRGGYPQMPPNDTHVVDIAGLAAVDAWINAMTTAPYPAPSPP